MHIVKASAAHGSQNDVFDICVRSPTAAALAGNEADQDDEKQALASGLEKQASGLASAVSDTSPVFYVLSGGRDRKAILWEFQKRGDKFEDKKLHEIKPCVDDASDCVRSVFLVQEMLVIGTAHNGLYLYPLDTSSDSLSPGDRVVLSSGHDEGKHKEGRINSVCCSHTASLFATGGSDETVILWDGRLADTDANARRALDKFEVGSSPMAMDWADGEGPAKSRVGVALKNGNMHILEVDEGKWKNKSTIPGKGCGAGIRFSPDAKFLAVGRRNGRLDLYGSSGETFEHLKGFSAHGGPCCALDWAVETKDSFFLRSNSYMPEELLFWQVTRDTKEPKQVRRMKDIFECQWLKEACRVSWPSQGLIRGHGDVATSTWRPTDHVSCLACAPTPQDKHLACGCDDGVLRLFARPCLSIRALGRPYFGHAAPIRSLSYNYTSDYVISASTNMALLQWQVVMQVQQGAGQDLDRELAHLSEQDEMIVSVFNRVAKAVRNRDFTAALEYLDDAYESISESVAAQDWDQQLQVQARKMLQAGLMQGERMKSEAVGHLEQGDIDRKGYPVSKMLEEIENLYTLFRHMGKLSSDLQPEVDKFRVLKLEADGIASKMQDVRQELGRAFGAIQETEDQLAAIREHLNITARGLSMEHLPSAQVLEDIEQGCGKCNEENGKIDEHIAAAREIGTRFKGYNGELLHSISEVTRRRFEEMDQVQTLKLFHAVALEILAPPPSTGTGEEREDANEALMAKLDNLKKKVEKIFLMYNSHLTKVLQKVMKVLMKHAKEAPAASQEDVAAASATPAGSVAEQYSDDDHDDAGVVGDAGEGAEGGWSEDEVASEDSVAAGKSGGVEESMQEEPVEDWESEEMEGENIQEEAGRPRVAPPTDDGDDDDLVSSDVEEY